MLNGKHGKGKLLLKIKIKKIFVMKLYQQLQSENLSNMFLYGSILLASIDYIGILDYTIKALLGGGVWFGYKLLTDYYSPRLRNTSREKFKEGDKTKENEN